MLFRLRFFGLPRSLPAATRSLSSPTQQAVVHHPYFVPRNSNGSLPVYTDVRNGGTRLLLTVRNIDGNIPALAKDLSESLSPSGSPEASRLRFRVQSSKHLIIQGGSGRLKYNIIDWLSQKGF
ncbi:mitochondrial large subunit ribosomal protein-domain-containing protein [Lentinula detonsa]|uniref:Large ribosomal subunit protein mL49 n=1 Tax=Lentinula detonsa TaxID=2804962 RepID=A0AA38URM2_9AGAR|nr:mitochondrial large subunit ribosomal protein-domain-containing protein [Lentinula detonsa]